MQTILPQSQFINKSDPIQPIATISPYLPANMVKKITTEGTPAVSEANVRALRSGAKNKANKNAALLSVLKPKDSEAPPAAAPATTKKRATENPRLDEEGWSFDNEDKSDAELKDVTMDDAKINDILTELNEGAGGEDDPIQSEDEEDQEKSPSASPVKKRSKKAVLDTLITPRNKKDDSTKTPKPAATSVTSTTSSNKRNATVMKADGSVVKSALKTKTKSATKVTPPEKQQPKVTAAVPEHKHKGIVIEASIDFRKPAFSSTTFENDPCKKTAHGLKQLLTNLHIGDPTACILPHGDPDGIPIGPGGVKVPENMTALSNYCKGFNPKAFQTKSGGGGGDRLDSLGEGTNSGGGKGNNNKSTAYFLFRLGCNKDPSELITQVSY
jgi:hypothetical protein